eukprot:gnl/Trimastix_PCT/1073.p1 GENE.gnl/Trimastix_PCT/1073~~gnl/Trimastix_PCT/1073.p1  ORF type:complete len:482 (+),score=117.87 gnl/Trimastix_PCT/1073:91-1536(+)
MNLDFHNLTEAQLDEVHEALHQEYLQRKKIDDHSLENLRARNRATNHEVTQNPPSSLFNGSVAGHRNMLLSDDGEMLFKPLLYHEAEWRNFIRLHASNSILLRFMPRVHGRVVVERKGKATTYLVLQNLIHGYRRPMTFDLKIGQSSDFERICQQPFGMKVHGYTGCALVRRVTQSWNDMESCLRDFVAAREDEEPPDPRVGPCADADLQNFSCASRRTRYRYSMIPAWLEQVEEIASAFALQTQFSLRGSSLIFIYDAKPPRRNAKPPAVYLIDVARMLGPPFEHHTCAELLNSRCKLVEPEHCWPDSIDHGICWGMQNTLKLLRSVHARFLVRPALFLCAPEAIPEDATHPLVTRLQTEALSAVVASDTGAGERLARLLDLRATALDEPLAGCLTRTAATAVAEWRGQQAETHAALQKHAQAHRRSVVVLPRAALTGILAYLLPTPELASRAGSLVLLSPSSVLGSPTWEAEDLDAVIS